MIDKLTKEQIARFPEYVDKWLKTGLCTDRVDFKIAQQISDCYYEKILGKKRVPIIIMPNPLWTWYAVCWLSNGQKVRQEVWQEVWQKVRQEVWQEVRQKVEQEVWQEVWQKVGQEVWQKVKQEVEQEVEQKVRQEVRQEVWQEVWQKVRQEVRQEVWQKVEQEVWQEVEQEVRQEVWQEVESFVCPYIDGQFTSSYFSYYDFINEVLDIKYENQENWDWYKSTSQIGYFYPLKNICIICDRPQSIKMKNGLPHSDNSPAIEYLEDFKIYALNGIKMKEEYVLTPAGKIDAKTVLAEKDIDVRRELIRKVGVKRMAENGTIVDEMHYYKLLDMRSVLMSNSYEPYLLMLNPSVPDTWHLEGVAHECKTVEQALNYRKPDAMKKIPIAIDGEPWYQQGDVCIWNRNAITLQDRPIVLT